MTRRSRKFENGGFSMKTRRMFSFHTTLEKFKNETILFVIKVNSRDFSGDIVFQKRFFPNCFRPHENEKQPKQPNKSFIDSCLATT